MEISWKSVLLALAIILIVISFILGYKFGNDKGKEGKDSELRAELERIEKVNRERKEVIDSLLGELEGLDAKIVEVKIRETIIDTIRVQEAEILRNLPIPESVEVLKKNLKEYENYIPRY